MLERMWRKGTLQHEGGGRWLDDITNLMNMNLSKLQETEDREAWRAVAHGVTKSQTRMSDWTAYSLWGFPAWLQAVTNMPVVQETWGWSLGQKDLLEKVWLPTSISLSREFHDRGVGQVILLGCKGLDTTEWLTLSLKLHTHLGIQSLFIFIKIY